VSRYGRRARLPRPTNQRARAGPGPDRPRSKRARRQQVRRGFECARLRDRTCRKNATVLFTVMRGAGVPDDRRMCRKHQVSGGRFKKEKRFRDKTRPNALSDQTIQCFNGFDDFNQLPGTRWQYPGPLISNIIIIPLLKLRKSGW
jgi:hypothetical protein